MDLLHQLLLRPSPIFGAACLINVLLCLWAETRSHHEGRGVGDDLTLASLVLLIVWLMSQGLVRFLGPDEGMKWFPAVDLAATCVCVLIWRRGPADRWRTVLALVFASMSFLHVLYWFPMRPRPTSESAQLARFAHVVALNIGTAMTIVTVGSVGGRHVAQAARRLLPRGVARGGRAGRPARVTERTR